MGAHKPDPLCEMLHKDGAPFAVEHIRVKLFNRATGAEEVTELNVCRDHAKSRREEFRPGRRGRFGTAYAIGKVEGLGVPRRYTPEELAKRKENGNG